MLIEERINRLGVKTIISRDALYKIIREGYPNYKDTSVRWVIYTLVNQGVISRLNPTQFIVGKIKNYYQKNGSEERDKVVDVLNKAFPHIRIVVYESTLLNEWVNHQVSRKVIFIESEKYFTNDIFRFIYNNFSTRVLLNPTKEDLYMYDGEILIVCPLISQSPINLKTRDIKIEKLIVDLYTKDLITEFVSEDEKDDVIREICKAYAINVKTVYAYAKRRNNLDIIKAKLSSYEYRGSL